MADQNTLETQALMSRLQQKTPERVRVDIPRPGMFHLLAWCNHNKIDLQLQHAGSLFADGYMAPADFERCKEAGFGIRLFN